MAKRRRPVHGSGPCSFCSRRCVCRGGAPKPLRAESINGSMHLCDGSGDAFLPIDDEAVDARDFQQELRDIIYS